MLKFNIEYTETRLLFLQRICKFLVFIYYCLIFFHFFFSILMWFMLIKLPLFFKFLYCGFIIVMIWHIIWIWDALRLYQVKIDRATNSRPKNIDVIWNDTFDLFIFLCVIIIMFTSFFILIYFGLSIQFDMRWWSLYKKGEKTPYIKILHKIRREKK